MTLELAGEDKPGTFISLRPDKLCAQRLYLWARRNGVAGVIEPKDMHVTLIYSKDVVPGFHARENRMVPVKVFPHKVRYAKFGPNREVLVLRLFSPAIERRHYQLKSLGFSTVYNPNYAGAYQAHMTLSYFYPGDIDNLPDFRTFRRPLIYTREEAESLKPDFGEKENSTWNSLKDRGERPPLRELP